MPRITAISGEALRGDTPEWGPLETLVGTDLCGWFMWMFEVELASGCRLHAYKHHTTRSYIHLAADARHAYHYLPGDDRYLEVDLAYAIEVAFAGWDRADPSPEEFAALDAAVERARRQAA